jgi:hypothetical protein
MADAENVLIGVTGGLSYAPAGTTIPTTVDGVLAAGFEDVGYISEDGVTQTIGETTNIIRAWGGDNVREVQTEHDYNLTTTLIETTEHSLFLYYGDFDAGAVEVKAGTVVRGPFVLDVLDGDKKIRIVIPDGQARPNGDVVYQTSEAIGYPLRITCYPDVTGVKAYIYTDLDES